MEARLSAITQLRHNDEHIYHRDTTVYVFTEVVPAASEENVSDKADEERVTAHEIITHR